jgi:hypothetical protein
MKQTIKNILKMAKHMVKTFEYEGFEDLTLEDIRVISVESGAPFGVVAMAVYEKVYCK